MHHFQLFYVTFIAILVSSQIQRTICSDEDFAKIEEKSNKLKDLLKLQDFLKSHHNADFDGGMLDQDQDVNINEYLQALNLNEQKLNDDEEDNLHNNEGESVDSDDLDQVAAKRSAYLRFGKRNPAYLRFGRGQAYLRFGKRAPTAYLRFGKRSPAYIRFGRSVSTADETASNAN